MAESVSASAITERVQAMIAWSVAHTRMGRSSLALLLASHGEMAWKISWLTTCTTVQPSAATSSVCPWSSQGCNITSRKDCFSIVIVAECAERERERRCEFFEKLQPNRSQYGAMHFDAFWLR
jgi:hypothetical protein